MLSILAEKIGMTQIFNDDGECVPVTVVKTKDCVVTSLRSIEKDGYSAVQLGADKKEKNISRAYAGLFKKENLDVAGFLKEFRVEDVGTYKVGQKIGVEEFENIDFVDVIGVSKGKGFQGVIKRHGFGGGPAGHGSHFHRAPGSIGNCSDPARVFKGKKMPGQMGNAKTTVQNLKVVACDKENGLLLIKGAVPGKNKGTLIVKKAIKKINQTKTA